MDQSPPHSSPHVSESAPPVVVVQNAYQVATAASPGASSSSPSFVIGGPAPPASCSSACCLSLDSPALGLLIACVYCATTHMIATALIVSGLSIATTGLSISSFTVNPYGSLGPAAVSDGVFCLALSVVQLWCSFSLWANSGGKAPFLPSLLCSGFAFNAVALAVAVGGAVVFIIDCSAAFVALTGLGGLPLAYAPQVLLIWRILLSPLQGLLFYQMRHQIGAFFTGLFTCAHCGGGGSQVVFIHQHQQQQQYQGPGQGPAPPLGAAPGAVLPVFPAPAPPHVWEAPPLPSPPPPAGAGYSSGF